MAALDDSRRPVRIALVFPGQGAQRERLGTGLYEHEPVFTTEMDRFFAAYGDEGQALRADWLSHTPRTSIDDATRSQPLLFAVGYALGTLVLRLGVTPTVLIGHSVGELAAAALAGVFTLAEGASLMLARSRMLAGTPAGGMLAVAASPDEVRGHAVPGVTIGAFNGPRQTVLTGVEPDLTRAQIYLTDHGLTCRRVRARQAFHGPAVRLAAAGFERAFAPIRLRAPSIPLCSTATAAPVTERQARRASFWARQLAQPVAFWPAVRRLTDQPIDLFVEAGPGPALAATAARYGRLRHGRADPLALLPTSGGEEAERATFLTARTRLLTEARPIVGLA